MPPTAVLDIRPTTIVGRLYQLPAGFPAVVIPQETILAHGTADPVVDARTQAEFASRGVTMPEVQGDWDVVHGEVITFLNPVRDLPPIDRLEGVRTAGGSLYRRALVLAAAGNGIRPAWVYHMAEVARGGRLEDGCWEG